MKERRLFPCYFGSALKLTGVEEFLKGLETFTAGTPDIPGNSARGSLRFPGTARETG